MAHAQKGAVDFNRSTISRYIQLATLFRSRISSGQWPEDQQMPTVDDLSEEFGVARATIRQALGLLENEGLIERFRAKGTFVRGGPRKELWCQVGTDWNGLLRSTDGSSIEVLFDRADVEPPHIKYPLGKPAKKYRNLHRRHSRDTEPFLITDVFIDERLRDRITDSDIKTKSALRLIADIPGITISQARQTLTIAAADVEMSESLGIPINSPVAIVHRRAVDSDGILVLIAEGTYRGDVVRLDIELR